MTRSLIWSMLIAVLVALGLARAGVAPSGFRLDGGRPAALDAAEPGARVVVIDGDLQGHFRVMPLVESARVTMLVDTGASVVSLRHEDALAAGLRPRPADYTRRLGTANGVAYGAPVRLKEVTIGGITVRNVDAVIMPPGSLGISLLGMSFLKRLAGFEIQSGRLRLQG